MDRSVEPFRLPRLSRTRTRHRETKPRWSEVLAQAGLFALMSLAACGPWMNEQGDSLLRQFREFGYIATFVAAVLAVRPWRHPERLLVVPWPLVVALAWCGLSLTWALEPAIGSRRLLLTIIVLWTLFALVRELGLERSTAILRSGLALLLLINFIAVLAWPSVGIHGANEADLANDWRGIMAQKNYAGLVSALTILVFTFNAATVQRAFRVVTGSAAVVFLLLSDSATSLGMTGVSIAFGVVLSLRTARSGNRPIAAEGWAWVPLGVFFLIFTTMAVFPAPYLKWLSDPTGFTGRYQIWAALIRLYNEQPLLGVGYGSLWDLDTHAPIAAYARGWAATVSHGHNGYLDLLVQIGAAGTLIVLFAVLVWPLQRLLRGGSDPVRVLSATMLLFCLGHNFTESTLFDRDSLGQVFLMLAISMLWNATATVASPGDERLEKTAAKLARV